MTRAIQKPRREQVRETLPVSAQARFNAQTSSESGGWLLDPLPQGKAPHDETLRVMLRTRLLLDGPEAPGQPADGPRCCHLGRAGEQCPRQLDKHGVHEALCSLGGGVVRRHHRVREWLADKVRETWGGSVRFFPPWP